MSHLSLGDTPRDPAYPYLLIRATEEGFPKSSMLNGLKKLLITTDRSYVLNQDEVGNQIMG